MSQPKYTKKRKTNHTCEFCGVKFKSNRDNQKYCSEKCQKLDYKKVYK